MELSDQKMTEYISRLNNEQRYEICKLIFKLLLQEYGMDNATAAYFTAHPDELMERVKNMPAMQNMINE